MYRIDLRDLQWNAQTWTRVLAAYPHHLPENAEASRQLAAMTRTELPFVRADWFVANAARPPLYHDILQLPLTDRDLERQRRTAVSVFVVVRRPLVSAVNFTFTTAPP